MARSRSKGVGGHHRPHHGETNDWLTPPEIIKALGRFDLDPCCPPNMPWFTAKHMVSAPADGLEIKWYGRVWLNPPYGPDTGKWLERLAEHGKGTALIFARTETDAWFRHVWNKASAILFIRGRLHFHRVDGTRAAFNSGAPSALVAYGEDEGCRLLSSGIPGHFVWI